MELACPVMKYHWGKYGSSSFVAQLKQASDSDFKIKVTETYAELWMGTHQNGPAVIKNDKIPLECMINDFPSSLGAKVQKIFGNKLPFLFKILSIAKPLSIQVHPEKEMARELHAKYPDKYKDPNHKPELAIALSDFEALCGFRPCDEIRQFLQDIDELSDIIGVEKVTAFRESDPSNNESNLKSCFYSLMTASEDIVKYKLGLFRIRLSDMDEKKRYFLLAELFEKIYAEYPEDVGCFCIYFFNYITLKPGESIYLGANEPHAYISGDCVECMACSDNVIRAGLTPKFRDVLTLCEILNYSCNPASSKILSTVRQGRNCVLYKPPVPDFAVRKVEIHSDDKFDLVLKDSASIFIIIEGTALKGTTKFSTGQVFFLAANESFSLHVPPSENTVLIFQAFVNV